MSPKKFQLKIWSYGTVRIHGWHLSTCFPKLFFRLISSFITVVEWMHLFQKCYLDKQNISFLHSFMEVSQQYIQITRCKYILQLWLLPVSTGAQDLEAHWLTVTIPTADSCIRLSVRYLSVRFVGKAKSGGLTSAKGNRSSVFTFMRAAERPEQSP